MHLIKRTTCRVCGSAWLTPAIDLGYQYLQGSFLKPGREEPSLRRLPTALVRCDPAEDEQACGLLQMEHTVPPEILYSVYWYRSGTNATMRDHLRGIASEAAALIEKKELVKVLDIGCNDGTLLSFYPENFRKFGIDPCDIAQEINPASAVIVHDFFPSKKIKYTTTLDIITSIAMFYDLEDPVGFAKEIKKVLAPKGILILEAAYLPVMLKNTSYDTICHEHVEYYTLAIIERILKDAGLKAVDVTLNDINGGSFRVIATHAENQSLERDEFNQNLRAMRRAEFDLELDTEKPYREFKGRVLKHQAELRQLLIGLKSKGKRLHIYGASTKGNTILQWCGIDKEIIDFAADRNPQKFGARTIGTDIPIISEAESRGMKPDYYLVLPWHFKKEFLEREKETLAQGTGFIFPLPEIEIIEGGKWPA